MDVAQSLFGVFVFTTIGIQFLVAYSALPISGNQAGLCILIPFYAFGLALRYKWRKLAGLWAFSFGAAVIALISTKG